MKIKLLFVLFAPVILLGIVFGVGAHGGVDDNHSSAKYLAAAFITKDQVVAPEGLGVNAPGVLPGNPFYFLKNAARGVQSLIAFSPESKAELKLRFANEKIVEAQIVADKGDKKTAIKHLLSYEKDLASAQRMAVKLKDKLPNLAEKIIANTLSHQAVLDKLEKEAVGDEATIVKNTRTKTIVHIAEAISVIGDADKIKNALVQASQDAGSPFKPLRNLEVLKAIEEKVPESAKAGIQGAQENAVKRFRSDYEKSSEEEKAALTEYIKGAGGDASRYLQAFNENKEILGEDLSGKLLSAGEEKRIAGGTTSITTSPSLPSVASECYPPVSPKPSLEAQSEIGTMTITPEISQESQDNAVVVSFVSHIDSLSIALSSYAWVRINAKFIDWGPKSSEINAGEGVRIIQGVDDIRWETHDYIAGNGRKQKRPRLPAQKYWVKFKADQTTPWDSDKNIGPYGWQEVKYNIHYVVGDASKQSDFITKSGKSGYYVGGPQFPVGKIVRVGGNAEPHYGKFVTVKAGEPFEIEAKPTGWQGGIMTIDTGATARIIGQDTIAVQAGESAIWKVLPRGTSPVSGRIMIKNICNDLFSDNNDISKRFFSPNVGSFEAPITYDFSGLKKEKARLTLAGAVAYTLDFAKPDSTLNIIPWLSYMDGQSVVANVPDREIVVRAVYKDSLGESAKNVLITPATAKTNKEGQTKVKITAPNITKEEVSRGIVLKLTAPSIPGLTFEQKLLFTNISIVVTPSPVVEKKVEPTPEPTATPKPYEGSPPLLY